MSCWSQRFRGSQPRQARRARAARESKSPAASRGIGSGTTRVRSEREWPAAARLVCHSPPRFDCAAAWSASATNAISATASSSKRRVSATADLLWQPSSSKYAPYFGGGIGGLSYTRRSQYPLGPGQPGQPVGARSTFTRSGTDSIFGGLAGVNVVATERFRVHPEVSLWLSRPGYFIVIEAGVLASYRF